MACVCKREGFNGLGVSTDSRYTMGLELDIPDEGYRSEGYNPALLVTLYRKGTDKEEMDPIRIEIKYCPFCGEKIACEAT